MMKQLEYYLLVCLAAILLAFLSGAGKCVLADGDVASINQRVRPSSRNIVFRGAESRAMDEADTDATDSTSVDQTVKSPEDPAEEAKIAQLIQKFATHGQIVPPEAALTSSTGFHFPKYEMVVTTASPTVPPVNFRTDAPTTVETDTAATTTTTAQTSPTPPTKVPVLFRTLPPEVADSNEPVTIPLNVTRQSTDPGESVAPSTTPQSADSEQSITVPFNVTFPPTTGTSKPVTTPSSVTNITKTVTHTTVGSTTISTHRPVEVDPILPISRPAEFSPIVSSSNVGLTSADPVDTKGTGYGAHLSTQAVSSTVSPSETQQMLPALQSRPDLGAVSHSASASAVTVATTANLITVRMPFATKAPTVIFRTHPPEVLEGGLDVETTTLAVVTTLNTTQAFEVTSQWPGHGPVSTSVETTTSPTTSAAPSLNVELSNNLKLGTECTNNSFCDYLIPNSYCEKTSFDVGTCQCRPFLDRGDPADVSHPCGQRTVCSANPCRGDEDASSCTPIQTSAPEKYRKYASHPAAGRESRMLNLDVIYQAVFGNYDCQCLPGARGINHSSHSSGVCCKPGRILCRDYSGCYSLQDICDGKKTCQDCSDETYKFCLLSQTCDPLEAVSKDLVVPLTTGGQGTVVTRHTDSGYTDILGQVLPYRSSMWGFAYG